MNALESRYDRQFKVVFDAIRGLMKEPEPKRREIRFTAKMMIKEDRQSHRVDRLKNFTVELTTAPPIQKRRPP